MIRKFCDICGKEEGFSTPLTKTKVYTKCTPNGRGNKRVDMEICDMCNYEILNAGLPTKIVSEVEQYKKLKRINTIDTDGIPTYTNEQIEELKKTGLIGTYEGKQVNTN